MILLVKYSKCIDEKINKTKQRSIVLKERSRRYELINEGLWTITKLIVEGCITSEVGGKGCEAILLAEKRKRQINVFS